MRWRTNSTGQQQFCVLFLLLAIFGAFGQDGLGKSEDEQIGAIGQNPEQQPLQGAQQRKDLNELPEMRKAKELRTEAERAEIEAERMRELAKLEAELKAKDEEMEATTEMAHAEPMEAAKSAEKVGALNSSNETLSSGEGAEEVAPSSEIGTGGGMGESGMEKEGGEGNVEGAMRQETALGSGEPVGNNSSENGNVEHKEAVELIGITGAPEGSQGDAVTAIQFQQEALVTTHRASSSSRPQGEEESAAADDPFQSSSTSAPSNGDRIGGGEKPEEHEEPMGHEMEHEVIQQTVHVHQPQNGQGEGGGSSGGGEEAMKELAMPGMGGGSGEMGGNGTTQSGTGQQQTETLVSTEIGGQKNEEKNKSGEESKENAEMHHEATVGQEEEETSTNSGGILHGIGEQHSSTPAAHPMMEGETKTTTMEQKREEGKEEEEGGKLPEAEHEATEMPQTSKEDAEEHPIVFPAAHLPDDHEVQTQQPPTTEESSVIVGDKSVFEQEEKERKLPEPEKAKIQLMSHEGEPKESSNETERPEESQPSTPMPMAPHPSGPLVNEGSDGFELITKEEHGDAPPPSNGGGTSEKPEEAKEIGEEEAEVLPTPADEAATQMPIEGRMGGGEAEHSGSMSSTMATTTMVAGQEEEHKMEGGMIGHGGIMGGETTTMGGPVEQQTAEMEADTPPQRGDLPGVETSHPMESEMKTTTMGPEMGMSTQQEDKSANEVQQEAESTSEAFPVPTTSMSPEQFEQAKSLAHRTPFSLRLPEIEWRPEFEDIESGAAKKLREQLDADLKAVLAAATGPTNPFVDFQFTGLRPGSVIVDGEMLTRDEVADPQAVVASLEQAILAKGGMLGGNAVDTDQLSVAGQMPAGSTSANNLMAAGQQKQQQQDATNTGLIIGGAVVVGVLIVVFAIFAIVVFGLNSRRNNCGSLKLSGGRREEICMVENGKGAGPFGGNGRRLFGSGGGGATNSANGIPSNADAAETGNGGVNLMSLRTTAGSNTPTLNGAGGHNNPNYGQQNGATRANGGAGGYANGTGSGARP